MHSLMSCDNSISSTATTKINTTDASTPARTPPLWEVPSARLQLPFSPQTPGNHCVSVPTDLMLTESSMEVESHGREPSVAAYCQHNAYICVTAHVGLDAPVCSAFNCWTFGSFSFLLSKIKWLRTFGAGVCAVMYFYLLSKHQEIGFQGPMISGWLTS